MSPKPAPDPDAVLVVSYLTLRKLIGILGLVFPFVVAVGAHWIFNAEWQQSLSAYYYTGTRNVFVGTLWAIGIFLFAYPGYNHRGDLLAISHVSSRSEYLSFRQLVTVAPQAPFPTCTGDSLPRCSSSSVISR